MTTVVLTVALSVDSSTTVEETTKLRDRMEAGAKLLFDNVEDVEIHVEPEAPQLRDYHVTGRVKLVAEVNAFIQASSEKEAMCEFIKLAKDGLDIKVSEGYSLDVQDVPVISINPNIDVDEQ